MVLSDRDNCDLEETGGLIFSRHSLKGLNSSGFSKEQSTSHSPTFLALINVAGAPGPPEAYTSRVLEWNNRIRGMRRINPVLIIPD